MAESVYRRNPKEGNVIKILQGRRNLLDKVQTANGQSASVRNPCWVQITGRDKSCGGGGSISLPKEQTTWDTTYRPNFKPSPDLESVNLENGGDRGLARKISATIRCYSITDFEQVQKYFLLPGNEIDVRFGYKNTWGVPQPITTLTNYKVASFSFNTNSEGHWIATFTAVSSGTAIRNLDMQIVVCNGCNAINGNGQSGTSGPLFFLTGQDKLKHSVKGVAQLIASDAQKNGDKSIDELEDGEVITSFKDYSPGSQDQSAAIVVYNGDHLRGMWQTFTGWIGGIVKNTSLASNEVESANNQVFVSIGYVVNRILNDQLLRSLSCGVAHERKEFSILKIEFDPEYSKCKIAQGITSGDPINVLLLGDANYKNSSGAGKDFDADCKNLGAVKCNTSGDIKIQNILVHRDIISSAFSEATQKREANADQVDVKDTGNEVINVINFFEKVADQISACTGGAIALRLIEHPTDNQKMLVVDQNYGVTDTLQCIVFDPVDGDGSTRTCEVQSNVGSQEYKAAMFVGSSKNGDSVSALRNCTNELKEQREKEYSKAKTDKDSLLKNPGNVGQNKFNGQDINALKSVMGRLYHNNPQTATDESVHYPGLSISLEIDGVYGLTPGNAVSSTQVPRKWREQYKSYFMVTTVNHKFQQSDWSTTINGILAYYPNIQYIQL
jgi:hypothetical protein